MAEGEKLRFGLDRLHRELSLALRHETAEVKRLRAAIAHVEAVIKLVAPDGSLHEISNRRRRKRIVTFKRSEIPRLAYQILRSSPEPLACKEIALRAFATKGKEAPDKLALYYVANAIRNLFRTMRGRAVQGHGGHPEKWSVIASPSA